VAEGNRLGKHGLPFNVIPNFVPDDLPAQAQPDHPALSDLPSGGFILFVGDVAVDKGANVLLDAYARLADPPPVVLIGRPYISLEQLPRGAIALGEVPHAAVVGAWRRSLFGVVPSIVADSCPTVVMEAMATERPVVASRSGGIPDLVQDGHTGVLVSPAEPAELASAMQSMLDSPLERARMGAAARRRFDSFTASRVVPRIEAIYRETLA
jgi:glycosyltransferase involved in cell wall biosynthesis